MLKTSNILKFCCVVFFLVPFFYICGKNMRLGDFVLGRGRCYEQVLAILGNQDGGMQPQPATVMYMLGAFYL